MIGPYRTAWLSLIDAEKRGVFEQTRPSPVYWWPCPTFVVPDALAGAIVGAPAMPEDFE